MYKPNFCAECGARIARLRWRLWTSRRFCADCDVRFRKGRILLPLLACLALSGIGFTVGRALRPAASSPLVIERGRLNAPPSTLPPTTALAKNEAATTPLAAAIARPYSADGTPLERPTDPDEVVSICGARTQKGTPCSRRVRGTGRCWQHRGKPAMLPAAKLIVHE